MNMVYLIYLDLCFLSSAFCSFQRTNPEYVLLDLHLSGPQKVLRKISGQHFKAERYLYKKLDVALASLAQ